MISKEFINYNNTLYWIYRKVKSTSIKDGYVNDIKEFWCCDIVVKHKQHEDDYLYFLREITELEILP